MASTRSLNTRLPTVQLTLHKCEENPDIPVYLEIGRLALIGTNLPHPESNLNAKYMLRALPIETENLTVSPVRLSIVTFPGLPPSSCCLVEFVTLAQPTRLLAGCRKSAGFAVFVHGLDNPIYAGIATNSLVLGVHEDDLKVFVG